MDTLYRQGRVRATVAVFGSPDGAFRRVARARPAGRLTICSNARSKRLCTYCSQEQDRDTGYGALCRGPSSRTHAAGYNFSAATIFAAATRIHRAPFLLISCGRCNGLDRLDQQRFGRRDSPAVRWMLRPGHHHCAWGARHPVLKPVDEVTAGGSMPARRSSDRGRRSPIRRRNSCPGRRAASRTAQVLA